MTTPFEKKRAQWLEDALRDAERGDRLRRRADDYAAQVLQRSRIAAQAWKAPPELEWLLKPEMDWSPYRTHSDACRCTRCKHLHVNGFAESPCIP